jgi:hypothetical protein
MDLLKYIVLETENVSMFRLGAWMGFLVCCVHYKEMATFKDGSSHTGYHEFQYINTGIMI